MVRITDIGAAGRYLLLPPMLLLLGGCQSGTWPWSDPDAAIREITVLYTNDEHGYMAGMAPGQSSANLVRLWQENEGYTPDGPYLVLSGGDNWTGPAISTWVEGQSMVEVMNAMGYDASAIGNHEFDFGLEAMSQRLDEADFPYLSANTVWQENGEVPVELGILPFTIREVNDLRIGIVGLTTTSTPYTTNPRNLTGLHFADYEQALRQTIPLVEDENPDLLFVISHVCLTELRPLISQVADLGIDLMGSGHCNELHASQIGGTVLLGGGYHYTSYASALLRYDLRTDSIVGVDYGTFVNDGDSEDAAIAGIVASWQTRFKSVLDEVVAYSASEIDDNSTDFQQAVVDTWLWSDPSADVAITNAGGLRAPLPAGEILFNDLVNTMPFENNIYALRISGRFLLRAIEEGGRPVIGGMKHNNDTWVMNKTGQPLEPDQYYRVLVNSFMYDGGNNYQALVEGDPNGVDTGFNYRQPLVDWLRSLDTSPGLPLTMELLATGPNG